MNKTQKQTHILDWEHDMNRGRIHNVNSINHWLRYQIPLKFIKAGHKVLEVGYGSAYLPRILYANCFKTEYVGLEIDNTKFKKIQKHFETPKWLYGDEKFITHNIVEKSLDYPDNYFDIICSFHVLEHMPKKDGLKFLMEINRLLKKGGKLILACPDGDKKELAPYHIYEWSRIEIENFLNYLGIKIESSFSQIPKISQLKYFVENSETSIKKTYNKLSPFLPKHILNLVMGFLIDDQAEDIFLICSKIKYKKNINTIETFEKEEAKKKNICQKYIKGYF